MGSVVIFDAPNVARITSYGNGLSYTLALKIEHPIEGSGWYSVHIQGDDATTFREMYDAWEGAYTDLVATYSDIMERD